MAGVLLAGRECCSRQVTAGLQAGGPAVEGLIRWAAAVGGGSTGGGAVAGGGDGAARAGGGSARGLAAIAEANAMVEAGWRAVI